MSKVKKAAFSIASYTFDRVIMNLSKKGSDELSLSFQPSGVFLRDEKKYILTFETKIRSTELKVPFITVNCRSEFLFEQIDSADEIPTYFYANSIAILFPYIRSYISIITTQANVGGVILPTLNLSSLEETLRTKTITK